MTSRDPVRLRELGAGETGVLDTVFDGLSTTSRFLRFHGAVPRLMPGVRERLAAVDGRRHIAVAAFVGREPIGIARLIAGGGGRAELAVEVVDRWQRRGVGTRLVPWPGDHVHRRPRDGPLDRVDGGMTPAVPRGVRPAAPAFARPADHRPAQERCANAAFLAWVPSRSTRRAPHREDSP